MLWMMLWCAAHPGEPAKKLTNGFIAPVARPTAWDIFGQGCIWPASEVALPAAVEQLILSSAPMKQVAMELGISSSTLRRQLEALGCRGGAVRAVLRKEQRRLQALEAVQAYLRAHPGASRTDVHRGCKAAVAWLGRHAHADLTRLLEIIPERRSRQLEARSHRGITRNPKL